MKASLTLRAPAKLNLTLEVLGRRDDGLHGLRSVMVPIDLYDRLLIEPAAGFSFECDVPELSAGNLVERAARALALDRWPVRLRLEKQIPTGAGMGGGSSDAAALLLAASSGVLGTPIDADYLALARELGSDVPFFLTQTAALVEGTGERVTALGKPPAWHALVVKPGVAVSTSRAYSQIDAAPKRSRPRNESSSLQMAQALQRADFAAAIALMQNDFEDVIAPATPEIAHALESLRWAGARKAMMTGSGSCVFALFEDAAERDSVQARIPNGETSVYACSFTSGEAWRSAA
jgi:4-diphosphocytidyl-2-C-methyl-D-erythritol kinase